MQRLRPSPDRPEPAHLLDELLDDLVRDLLEDIEPLDRKAGLATVEEPADAGRTDSGVDVCVGADDHRIGASELEGQPFDSFGSHRHDPLSDRGRARKCNLADDGMLHERLSELGASTGDDVEDAGRNTSLVHEFGDARRRLGGLGHDGVAGDQRGAELVPEQGRREVPRDDRSDDADSSLEDEPVRRFVKIRDVAATEVLGKPGVVLERMDEASELELRLPTRLALLLRQE